MPRTTIRCSAACRCSAGWPISASPRTAATTPSTAAAIAWRAPPTPTPTCPDPACARSTTWPLSFAPEAARGGVIAVSAGNHAQAVAHHARGLGIPAVIVMPQDTPFLKVERTANLGATVVLAGADLTEAEAAAAERAARDGLTMVHPYDDAAVIAGQGTVALEMLADAPDLAGLMVPVGGGGPISGI